MGASAPYFVPSEQLSELRSAIKYLQHLGLKTIEQPTKYRLVVDTNIILQELIWLVCNRKDKSARSGLQEVIDSTAAEVFVPPKLIYEVEKHMGSVAEQYGADLACFELEWESYQERLQIIEPDDVLVQELRNGVDPDDADFVALAKQIAAMGIISKDPHIGLMGGNQLSFDIILSFRDFARSKAIELHLKVMGSYLSLGALLAIGAVISGATNGIKKLPDWAKYGSLIVIALAYAHPTSRKKINGFVSQTFDSVKKVSPSILEPIKIAAEEARQKGEVALKKQKDIDALANG